MNTRFERAVYKNTCNRYEENVQAHVEISFVIGSEALVRRDRVRRSDCLVHWSQSIRALNAYLLVSVTLNVNQALTKPSAATFSVD